MLFNQIEKISGNKKLIEQYFDKFYVDFYELFVPFNIEISFKGWKNKISKNRIVFNYPSPSWEQIVVMLKYLKIESKHINLVKTWFRPGFNLYLHWENKLIRISIEDSPNSKNWEKEENYYISCASGEPWQEITPNCTAVADVITQNHRILFKAKKVITSLQLGSLENSLDEKIRIYELIRPPMELAFSTILEPLKDLEECIDWYFSVIIKNRKLFVLRLKHPIVDPTITQKFLFNKISHFAKNRMDMGKPFESGLRDWETLCNQNNLWLSWIHIDFHEEAINLYARKYIDNY